MILDFGDAPPFLAVLLFEEAEAALGLFQQAAVFFDALAQGAQVALVAFARFFERLNFAAAGFELAEALFLAADFAGERFAGDIAAPLQFALGGKAALILVIDQFAHFAGDFGDDFAAIVGLVQGAELRVLF